MVNRTSITECNSAKGTVEIKVDMFGNLYLSEKIREQYENGYDIRTIEIPVKEIDVFLNGIANASIESERLKKEHNEKEIIRYEKMIDDAAANLKKLQLELENRKTEYKG